MRIIKIVFTLIIIISLALFIQTTDLRKVSASLSLIGFRFSTILITTFIAYLLGTIGWRFCMGTEGRSISIFTLFMVRQVSEAVALLNPASIIGGDAVKVGLLDGKGLERNKVISSVIISRFVMIFTQVLLLLTASFVVIRSMPAGGFGQNILVPVLIVVVIIAGLFVTASRFSSRLRSWFVSAGLPVPAGSKTGRLKVRVRAVFQEVFLYFATQRKALTIAVFFFTSHWLVGSLEFFFILKFLGISINPVDALFLDMGVIIFKSAGAFVPAQAGFEEYGNKIMLSLVGIAGDEIWITVSLLKRMRQLTWITAGCFFYLCVKKKYRYLFK